MGDIPAINRAWDNNAQMIADVAKLGYIEGRVLDLTYGEGKFWTLWSPGSLVTNDWDWSKPPASYRCDFRNTVFESGEFDTVVFDPPYKLQGTPASPDMDEAYGTEEPRTRIEVLSLLVSGIAEGARLTRRWLLVKCQDQVSSGQVRWQTQAAIDTARALELRLIDEFHLTGGRPQPEGRRQVHARRNYSTLLVFGTRAVKS